MKLRNSVAFVVLAALGCASTAFANEIMTDRCSAEVAFVTSFNNKPNTHGTHILKRDAGGHTPWTKPFEVQTDDSGFIRWWCHSTTGDFLDPGTWELSVNAGGVIACLTAVVGTVGTDGAAAPTTATCIKAVSLGSSAFRGWTPERSRCSDHSKRIRVRLGPNRLLQTECLGQ
jgi:hypothetical protein